MEERARTSTANHNQGSNWIRRTTRIKLYQRDGWTCRYCGKRTTQGGPLKRRATLDHLDADHTNNAHDNLATVCYACNSRRQNKPQKEFLKSIGAQTGGAYDDELHPRDKVGRFTFKNGKRESYDLDTLEQVAEVVDRFFGATRGYA